MDAILSIIIIYTGEYFKMIIEFYDKYTKDRFFYFRQLQLNLQHIITW